MKNLQGIEIPDQYVNTFAYMIAKLAISEAQKEAEASRQDKQAG